MSLIYLLDNYKSKENKFQIVDSGRINNVRFIQLEHALHIPSGHSWNLAKSAISIKVTAISCY